MPPDPSPPPGEALPAEMIERADHELIVHFEEGDTEYLVLRCNLTGPDRSCAVIHCPVDHEDVDRTCIENHGAKAQDECWAVQWYDAGGRETLNTEALDPVTIPVKVWFDDGVAVENHRA